MPAYAFGCCCLVTIGWPIHTKVTEDCRAERYLSKYGPTYKVSFAASVGLLPEAVVSMAVMWWFVAKRDPMLKQGEVSGDDDSSVGEDTMKA